MYIKIIVIFIILFSIPALSSAQVDSLKIKHEIELLTNDSLKNMFWDDMYQRDQAIFTDTTLTRDQVSLIQIDNLLWVYFFFKRFGNEAEPSIKTVYDSYTNPYQTSNLIWTHCGSIDLKMELIDLLNNKEAITIERKLDHYYAQSLFSTPKTFDSIFDSQVIQFMQRKPFSKINSLKLYEYAHQYYSIVRNKQKIITVGTWKDDRFKKSIIQLNDNFFFKSTGGYSKLSYDSKIFYPEQSIDRSYLKINHDAKLDHYSSEGKLVKQYLKFAD